MTSTKASIHASENTHLQRYSLMLPNEVIDIIFKCLDGPTQICFALTCRTLHGSYFRKTDPYYRRKKDWYWRKGFLCRLEKDNPQYYCCLQCAKLHRWDVPSKEDWSGSKQWKGHLDCHSTRGPEHDYFEFPVGEDYSLTYHAVRVIMNRHRYGPRHGTPLEAIELDTHKLHQETGTTVDMTVRPRIIDDELFLSVRHNILHPQNDTQSLENFINQVRWRVCRHLQIGTHWTGANCWSLRKLLFLPRRIPELEQGCWPCQDCTSEFGSVRSCQVCMTDYQLKISRQYEGKRENGWSIEITVWHQLGNGRDPYDEDRWFNLAHDGYRGPTRNSMPGIVRHRWSKGDGTLLAVEGEFVEGLEGLPIGLTMDEEGNVGLGDWQD
ncbi:hypothetical protein CEP54_008865 [Fusarium duplospermum]|uniref:F-box domain-containing protein n=1 Tax=Fusarium duplospermum TaxID=1325734 RepID=A0A428PTR9_9HYPO|nr:hypothetical protein CEP54_008865 [Fusarium duplospermum]